MKKNFLFFLFFFQAVSFLIPCPSFCKYIDNEKGVCYDSEPETIIKNLYDGKKRHWLITIDGMEKWSTIFSFWPETESAYLYEAINKKQYFTKYFNQNDGVIKAFVWSRDMSTSDTTVRKLYEQIKWLNDRDMPVSILAHSWGTVIAFLTLQRHSDIKIEKFITIGSPLASKNKGVASITRSHLLVRGFIDIKKPPNIKTWHNYFLKCDSISAPICNIGKENNFILKKEYDDVSKCHSSYFNSDKLWSLILRDAILDIHPMTQNWSWPAIR